MYLWFSIRAGADSRILVSFFQESRVAASVLWEVLLEPCLKLLAELAGSFRGPQKPNPFEAGVLPLPELGRAMENNHALKSTRR